VRRRRAAVQPYRLQAVAGDEPIERAGDPFRTEAPAVLGDEHRPVRTAARAVVAVGAQHRTVSSSRATRRLLATLFGGAWVNRPSTSRT